MNKPFKPSEELVSLNEELYTEFAIVELEQRLETDPLMFADFITTFGLCENGGTLNFNCSEGGNLCAGEHTLIGSPCSGGKFKENATDICSPICDSVL